MTYHCVIFDFDGTLADSFPLFVRTFNAVAARYRFRPVGPDELELVRTLDARSLLRRLKLPFWKVPLVARTARRLMTEAIDEVRPFEGVPALLHQLHGSGVRLAIVSSNTESNVRRVLGPDTAALISDYACGVSIFGKARAFRRVQQRSGVARAQTLCIGDELRDWQAAEAAGLAFGAVTWGYTQFAALPGWPDRLLFGNVVEIARVVLATGPSTT